MFDEVTDKTKLAPFYGPRCRKEDATMCRTLPFQKKNSAHATKECV